AKDFRNPGHASADAPGVDRSVGRVAGVHPPDVTDPQQDEDGRWSEEGGRGPRFERLAPPQRRRAGDDATDGGQDRAFGLDPPEASDQPGKGAVSLEPIS